MYKFSTRSKQNLLTADPKLIKLFFEVIKYHDCTVIYGHRTKEEQEEMVRKGYSKLHFPHSKHNLYPSQAVDVVPYPIDWEDKERFYYFAGLVKGVANMMGIPIRWGNDWDSDNDFKDTKFVDMPHYELI